ncbi:MAG: hypothetical protein QOJ70_3576 [Acidobacteriota bacterium]|jgi:hypothetical protein|nr:hypothetical protein [Acidobacteriota bacterium]
MLKGEGFSYEGGDNTSGALAETLRAEWERLCADYLPVCREGLIWRYSRGPRADDAEQGWKLHVSATVLTASEVLKRIAPVLLASGERFKAPASLRELQKLNCGLFYGYSQVGKFITVYPRAPEEAVALALRLYELTRGMSAPPVPFDRRFRPDAPVFYRYGSFRHVEIENPDGTRTPAMRDPNGRLVADVREAADAKPEWVSDPFAFDETCEGVAAHASPLATTFRAFEALAQRGKGGVYKALDLSTWPPRLCVLKEGRAAGELAWDGRDGHWRVKHEEVVLRALREAGVPVPRVYASFEVEGNGYLVTEYVEGETLQSLLLKRRRRLGLARAFAYGLRLATLLSRMHEAGWAWRDCKPANVVVTADASLRPLDFEGACPAESPDQSPWGTAAFMPPASAGGEATPHMHQDIYALGASLYLLLTGRLYDPRAPVHVWKLRRGIGARARRLLTTLLSAEQHERPSAVEAAGELAAVLSELEEARGVQGTSRVSLRRRRAAGREVESSRKIPETRVGAEVFVDGVGCQKDESREVFCV